jgi:hypothetical protein
MSCRNFETMLDAYVDNELSAEERLRVERHLSDCPDCRAAVSEVRSLMDRAAELPRGIPPRRDLFPEIRARIEEHHAGSVGREKAPRARRVRWIGLAASLLIVAIAGSTALWLRDGTSSLPPVATLEGEALPAASGGDESIDAAIHEYVEAADLLLAAIDERQSRLSPETRKVLEKNLAIIDQAIEEVRLLLEADPSSRDNTVLLRAMHEQKVQFLRRVSRLST